MNQSLEKVPVIDIPLHTLMELTPKADGTMAETRFHIDVDKALQEMDWMDSSLKEHEGACNPQSDSEIHADDLPEISDAGLSTSFPGRDGGFRRSVSMAELAASEMVIAQHVRRMNQNYE